jgi:hypothetical protein
MDIGHAVLTLAGYMFAVLQINTRACAGIRQRKVHFHWVLRSADGMFWLERILETIAQADQQRRFELHVHITGAHCVPGALPAAVLVSETAAGFLLLYCNNIAIILLYSYIYIIIIIYTLL